MKLRPSPTVNTQADASHQVLFLFDLLEMQSSKTPRPKSSNWPHQSAHTVLVRNLQLLELDQLDDWPGITPRTFSPSSQNQRQRIKAVEWILYRLIALWDPETARDKLRPFFPPLEPLQSVNLRAALFRVLSDVKKNGNLGRETILRKSMLDDCKGEKFDELLAVFSTNVVRKKKIHERNPSIDLSLASGLSPQDYPLLLPLILAHRVSLKSFSKRRDRVRDTQENFLQLLDKKKNELDSRSTPDKQSLSVQETDLEALAREVKANWQGSVEWADTLLYGGLRSGRDAFLELPFDSAWTRAKESTVDDLRATASRPDLVTDLESRVLRQRARLQRWHQYTDCLRGPGAASPSKPTGKATPQLAFRDHQNLTVASISKAVRQPVTRSVLTGKDQSLLRSVSEAMERINGSKSEREVPSTSTSEPEFECEPEPKPEPEPITLPEPTHRLPRQIPSISRPEIFEPLSDPLKSPSNETLADEYTTNHPSESEPPKRFTLTERTRKSMSLLPPPRELPCPNPRSRKSRVSFPVNQFETPPRASTTADFPSRASTPRDELFEEEADYASIFKSRPRIALSPVTSPAVHVGPIGDFDLSGDVDWEEG
ncbi:HAUS augmin-like complex subunit 6 N-terminus-domain-containing protein [Aspergillus pseudoustus]|uniref:HAUS augmin-like complex subunit 6 N-terminus-domain-containing protein n=1 Tax=Aspergillus pseudoustus TaxID=1810923 RepID=A0ABR4K935_9EURO